MKSKLSIFTFFLALVFCVELLGAWITSTSVNTWYHTLHLPTWRPPRALFGPVWTCIYFLLGCSGALVYLTHNSKERTLALILWSLNLLLNLSWSLAFFLQQSPLLAGYVILCLWLCLLMNIMYTQKVSKVASVLLVPYILWLSFAALLNWYIVMMN